MYSFETDESDTIVCFDEQDNLYTVDVSEFQLFVDKHDLRLVHEDLFDPKTGIHSDITRKLTWNEYYEKQMHIYDLATYISETKNHVK